MHFTINEAKKIVRYTLYRGLHYIEVIIIISRFFLISKLEHIHNLCVCGGSIIKSCLL